MARIHLHETTTSTPEQFVAGLTDFGPGRQELFGRSADGYLKVHDQGSDEADVTEGSGGIWERLHYDWSDPTHVKMTTTDSNLWGGDSGHTYTLTRKPDGTTDVDVVVVREGKNVRGRLLGLTLTIFGKRVLGKELGKTVKAIEARNDDGRHDHPPLSEYVIRLTCRCAGIEVIDRRRRSMRKVGKGLKASKVGTIRRSDGKPQVTYNHHPLYLFVGDKKPGQTNGQGIVAFGGRWSVVSPAGRPVSH